MKQFYTFPKRMTIVLLMILGTYCHSLMAACPNADPLAAPQDNTLIFTNNGTGSMTITSIYFTGSPITITAGTSNSLTCRGGGSPTEFFYSGGTAVQVSSVASGATKYPATLSGGFITIPATVLEENQWGTESPSKGYSSGCTGITYKLGSGAYQEIVLAANTYYDFAWTSTGAINGYKASIISGGTGNSGINGSNQFSITSSWFSGSPAPTIRVLAKRSSGSWDCAVFGSFTIKTSQPIGPSGGTKSPNVATICTGTGVSLSSTTAGTRGEGCSDDYIWLINGASQGAYTLGSTVGTTVTAGNTISIQGRRGACGGGCTATAYTTLATWTVVAQPASPSGGTKSPNLTNICTGTSVSLASTTAGTGGDGCSDDYIWLINGVAQGAYTLGSSVGSGALATNVITIQGRRNNCTSGAGCTGTGYTTLATWTVNAQPSGPSGGTKTPNVTNICTGTNVSLASTSAGSGGFGCSDDYIWLIDGVSQGAYSLGGSVGSGATAGQVIKIQGRRSGCTAGAGCTGTSYVDLATWAVNAQPIGPSGGTKTPNLTNICTGTSVSLASTTAGTGGFGCSDDYIWLINGVAQGAYTLGGSVGSGATAGQVIKIQGRRSGCTAGAGCSGTSYVDLATWTVNAQPIGPSGGTKTPNVTNICTGTNVSLASTTVGSGGFGCSDDYIWLIDGVSQGAYSLGGSVGSGATAGQVIKIQGRRSGCTAAAGCSGTSYVDLATWTVDPDPTSPTTATKSPNVSTVCDGTTLTISGAATGGNVGISCSVEYRYSTDNGSTWSSASTSIPSFAAIGTLSNDNIIQSRRNSCQTGCDQPTTWNEIARWITVPNPDAPNTSTKNPSDAIVCAGTTLSLSGVASGGTNIGIGCSIEYQYSTNNGTSWTNTATSVPSFAAVVTAGSNIIQARRSNCLAGCNTSAWYTVASWGVVAQPVSGILTKTPNTSAVCEGGNISAALTAGSGGAGTVTDVLEYRTDNGGGFTSWTAYTSGTNISTTGLIAVEVQTYRTSSVTGCTTGATNTVSWTINPQPVTGTLTKTPNTAKACEGSNVSAVLTAGSGGAGTVTDVLEYRYNSTGGWSSYTSGTNLSTTGKTFVEIRTYRTATGSNCTTSSTTTVIWDVDPAPSATPVVDYISTCDASASISYTVSVAGTFSWNETSGSGSPSTSTNNPLLVTSLTPGSTSVYQLLGSLPGCTNIVMGTVNLPLPTNSTTTIATTASCGYCVVTDGNSSTFYNSNGQIIGKIEDDPSVSPDQLNLTEMCTRINGSVQTVPDNLGNNQPYLQRQWTISPANNTKAKVTLYFTNAELVNLYNTALPTIYQFSSYNLLVTKYPGGSGGSFTAPASLNGVSVPAVFNSYGTDHKVEMEVSTYSTFYIHPSLFPFAPLPVELTSFTGWNQGMVNRLQWITASEQNTLKFEIQKSTLGGSWSVIGEKAAAGNSSSILTYDFSDNNPIIGNNYYRLKIIDNDGVFNYSNVINIPISNVINNSFVQVYPNPTSGILNVDIQATSSYDIKMATFDIIGKKVLEKPTSVVKGLNTLTIDYSTLAKGTYVLQYSDGEGKIHTTKFIKD